MKYLHEYTYFLANASLTLRVIRHLAVMPHLQDVCVTVIHQINGWVIRIKIPRFLSKKQAGDFQAFLSELGIPYQYGLRMEMAFSSLDMGDSPLNVMGKYKIAIVSHGHPNIGELENFREQISQGLGYRPETLA